LDVAVRAERVAPGARFAAQVGRVVDLAVADHPDLAVRTLERLVAGREVHDRGAPRARSGPRVSDGASAGRAPVAGVGGQSRERPPTGGVPGVADSTAGTSGTQQPQPPPALHPSAERSE